MRTSRASSLVWALCVLFIQVGAVDLNVDSDGSVQSATNLIAKGLMDYYEGDKYGGTVGMMVDPYYWWEAGAAWNSMLDFWYLTGNDSYNKELKASLLYQRGSNNDYMPTNQSTTEGNDDQGFWGITVMAAAERNFSNPDGKNEPGWLYLAQAVFNTMAARWDEQHCGGGLRWQIYTWNSGYDYKNTVSNGCFFNLAARLARYTNNHTYADWANKIFDWTVSVQFLQNPEDTGGNLRLYDGASLNQNCSQHSKGEWTYNYGLFMSGAAFLYNYTNGSSQWEKRATALWQRSQVFFDNGVMYEASCAPLGGTMRCNNDQRCFRGIFSRFLGHTAIFVDSLRNDIMSKLASSASAAAKSCSGGTDGHTCGLDWTKGSWDGKYGLGEQMCALEVMQNNLILQKHAPLSNSTGGSSKGSADAGTQSRSLNNPLADSTPVTGKDRAGAGVITALCLVGLVAIGVWMIK